MRFRLDLNKYSEIWAQTRRTWRNIGQILIDLARFFEIRPDFDQNPAKFRPPVANPKLPDMHLKPTRPDPADPKLYTGRLWVPISPTQVCRVESELGTNLTRADSWTPLSVNSIREACKFGGCLLRSTIASGLGWLWVIICCGYGWL